MKIMFRLTKPLSGLRLSSTRKETEALHRFLNIPPENLDVGLLGVSKDGGRDVVTFQFRNMKAPGPVQRFRSVYRNYADNNSLDYRGQFGRRNIDPAPELGHFGTLLIAGEVQPNGILQLVLPPLAERPAPVTSQHYNVPRRNAKLPVEKTSVVPAPVQPQDGTALVLMSFAGKEMTFTLPLGEAFEMAVNLTAKGYGK